MALIIDCPSCAAKLRLADNLIGKQIQCPFCKKPLQIPSPEQPPEAALGSSASKETLPEEEMESGMEEPPKSKKRKKKRVRSNSSEPEPVNEYAWAWWLYGGVGIVVVVAVLARILMNPESSGLVRFYATQLMIMLPISMVIFFAAVLLSSLVFGELDIGEFHVALVKAFFLCLFVNLVLLITFGGMISFFAWLFGVMVFFRLDPWETRILVFINWALNWILIMVLAAVMMSKFVKEVEKATQDPNSMRGHPASKWAANYSLSPKPNINQGIPVYYLPRKG
ncbi:MAG: hypothetical protein EXR99_07525 [Gemmataceae bacterium]|nr:hypothetical protein [Gemmataceae bacterium]